MHDRRHMSRRAFLAKSALAAGAVAAAPLLGTEKALGGVGLGELNLVGLDHVGITVPNINQAIEWYEDILGAVAPLTFGPFEGAFLEGALNVVARTKIGQITSLPIGRSAGPRRIRRRPPPSSLRFASLASSDRSGWAAGLAALCLTVVLGRRFRPLLSRAEGL